MASDHKAHEAAEARDRAAHDAKVAADAEAKAKGVPKPGPGIVAPRPDLLLALIAVDWIVGDKKHYQLVRDMTLRLLENLGEDGKEAKARLEGMERVPLGVPPAVPVGTPVATDKAA